MLPAVKMQFKRINIEYARAFVFTVGYDSFYERGASFSLTRLSIARLTGFPLCGSPHLDASPVMCTIPSPPQAAPVQPGLFVLSLRVRLPLRFPCPRDDASFCAIFFLIYALQSGEEGILVRVRFHLVLTNAGRRR